MFYIIKRKIKKIFSLKYDSSLPEVTRIVTEHRPHIVKLTKSRANLKQTKYLFTDRTANLWNALPEHAVIAISTNLF